LALDGFRAFNVCKLLNDKQLVFFVWFFLSHNSSKKIKENQPSHITIEIQLKIRLLLYLFTVESAVKYVEILRKHAPDKGWSKQG
jgi:hypothetical protein